MNPTELLIQTLEDFGEDEPEALVVIYTTEGGRYQIRMPDGSSITSLLGMLEVAKRDLLALAVVEDDE